METISGHIWEGHHRLFDFPDKHAHYQMQGRVYYQHGKCNVCDRQMKEQGSDKYIHPRHEPDYQSGQ